MPVVGGKILSISVLVLHPIWNCILGLVDVNFLPLSLNSLQECCFPWWKRNYYYGHMSSYWLIRVLTLKKITKTSKTKFIGHWNGSTCFWWHHLAHLFQANSLVDWVPVLLELMTSSLTLLDSFGRMESINVACVLQEAGDADSRACTRSQV